MPTQRNPNTSTRRLPARLGSLNLARLRALERTCFGPEALTASQILDLTDHVWWVITTADDVPLAYASAVYREGIVLLSRAGVIPAARGQGLQRKLIQARVAWARKLRVRCLMTYTNSRNWASMANLADCGFRLYGPKWPWAGEEWAYWRLMLAGGGK